MPKQFTGNAKWYHTRVRNRAASYSEKITQILGYIGILVQFIWALILYGSWLVLSGALERYIDNSGTTTSRYEFNFVLPEEIRAPLTIVIFVCTVLIALVMMKRTPVAATHITIRATDKTARVVAPVARKALHKRSFRKRLTNRLVLLVTKIMFSSLLLLLSLVGVLFVDLNDSIIAGISTLLWTCSILLALIHYALSKRRHRAYHPPQK